MPNMECDREGNSVTENVQGRLPGLAPPAQPAALAAWSIGNPRGRRRIAAAPG